MFLLGLMVIQGTYHWAGVGETPLIYKSVIVQFILMVGTVLFLLLCVFLGFFYSWKLLLLLLLIGFLTERLLVIPVIERFIIVPIARLLAGKL